MFQLLLRYEWDMKIGRDNFGTLRRGDKQRINDYWDEQLEMKNIIEYIK